jgi:hypothetical protein
MAVMPRLKSPAVLAVLGATFLIEATVQACTASFDGDTFLRKAASRGLVLKSPVKCLKVELQNNSVFAPPDSFCEVVFPNASWLADGITFQSILASGRFEAERRPDGIYITVKAGGGMRFDQVAVMVPDGGCESLAVDEVLTGAKRPPPARPPATAP